jgi:GNAT superfamily N-acetyltransferase
MTAYDVRPARLEDADAFGRVHIQVWREAYAGLIPADFLAGLSSERSSARFAQRCEQQSDAVTLVATADGELVGFAGAGPSRDEPAEPADELYFINILAAHHGTGLADRLFTDTLAAAGIDGPVSLWVLRGNDRACEFYTRHGFAPDGQEKPHPGTGTIEERWVRPGPRTGHDAVTKGPPTAGD